MRISSIAASLASLTTLLVAACSGGKDHPDASPIVIPDAPIDAPKPCTATAMYGTVTPMGEIASRDVATSPAHIYYDAAMNMDTKFDDLSIQLFKGYGAYTGTDITPGVVAITGPETNFATCGACVLIYTDLDPANMFMEDSIYMATSGTINIQTTTPNIKGTISNVNFTHVTIDQTTQESTPVGDCVSNVASMAFDFLVTTDPPPFAPAKKHLLHQR